MILPSSLVEGWMPPSREKYESILFYWQILCPLAGSAQYLNSWYAMGKTSVVSRFNLPGRIGWMLMEVPAILLMLYIMNTLPRQQGIEDLPWQNKVLVGLFIIHYVYRSIIFPLLAPSISPVHIIIALSAISFHIFNTICLGGWLAAYGPTTAEAWAASSPFATERFVLGILIFYLGLAANFFHDEKLREIRQREMLRQERIRREAKEKGTDRPVNIDKHYRIPEGGLFRWILYPHYLSEWIEWGGFWIACGFGCAPARAFVVNEVLAMFPRAVNGKTWYKERFGEEKISKKWVILPGVY